MKITNPYENLESSWLKGALHNHSTNSDGEVSPIETAQAFEELGFDFMALTDHRNVPSDEELYIDGSILVIPGCGYRGEGADSEIGVIGVKENIPQVEGVKAHGGNSHFASGDIDSDGRDEFIYPLGPNEIIAVDHDAPDHILWRAHVASQPGTPVLADIDGDGLAEIVVCTVDGYLNVLK